MKDRIPKDPGRVMISPENGSAPFYATMTRADNPEQEGTPLNKNSLLKDETAALLGLPEDAVPDDALKALYGVGFKLLAEYKTAGSYIFTVPDDVDELGVLVLGGGGSGACANASANYGVACGGGSGELVQKVLKKSNGDFSAGEEIAVVVGAKGAAVSVAASTTTNAYADGKNGGTSSFKGITAAGGNGGKRAGSTSNVLSIDGSGGSGQSSDCVAVHSMYHYNVYDRWKAPFGMVAIWDSYDSDAYRDVFANYRHTAAAFSAMNRFDPSDTHVYCGAGGGVIRYNEADPAAYPLEQSVVTRARGRAGAGKASVTAGVTAPSATAPGDGGGSALGKTGYETKSGAGAAGLVLVYGRKTI